MQQQQELIEDEAEQEQEEQEARKADIEAKKAEEARKKEADEAEKAAKAASAPAPSEEELAKAKSEEQAKSEADARMSKEQLGELAEALNILTAKNSIVKERDELRSILEDNLLSEAVSPIPSTADFRNQMRD